MITLLIGCIVYDQDKDHDHTVYQVYQLQILCTFDSEISQDGRVVKASG